MHWILFLVLALVLVFSASRFPRLAFSLLGVLVAVAAALYYMSDPPSDGLPENIDPADVAVSNVTMVPYYAGGYKATGDITNNSKTDDLTDLVIRFSVEDCPAAGDEEQDCKLVSSVEERVRVHVPPGATRTFEQPVAPRRTAVEGSRRWKFKVVKVTGRKPLREIYE